MPTTTRKRTATFLLASALGLSGCFGSSDDKGDNVGSIITPRPAATEDANTAGARKTVLPEPPGDKPEPKAATPSDAAPK